MYIASHCMLLISRGTCKELGTLSSLHTQLVLIDIKQPLEMKPVWHMCRTPPM